MDESDSYRELCSTETLRSGKKGFFHDFSSHVMSVAGDTWMTKIFSRSANDRERIRSLLNGGKVSEVVLEILSRVQPLFRDKDAEISRKRRLEGFQLATAGQLDKALLMLSQAVLRAPVVGKCENIDRGYTLPFALLGRAEVFMGLKEYDLALEDLAMAAENDLPIQSKLDLQRKRAECEKILKQNAEEKALVATSKTEKSHRFTRSLPAVAPSLTVGENSTLPGASSLLEIRETEMAGKQAVALMEIEPGDCLVVEAPLASCLLPEFYGTHCQHCYSRLTGPVGCPNCSSVAFCSRKCRDVALSTYHKYECKILAMLIGSGMSVLSMLAFRMVTQEGLKGCLKIYNSFIAEKNGAGDEIVDSSDKTDTSEIPNEPTNENDNRQPSKLSKSARRRLRKKKLQGSKAKDSCANGSDAAIETAGIETEKIWRTQSGDNFTERKVNENLAGDVSECVRQNGKRNGWDEGSELMEGDGRAYRLVTHHSRRSARDFLERTLMAAFLLKCLQRVGFFGDASPNDGSPPSDEELAVGSVLLRNLQLLQFNAHEFFETRRSPKHRFHGSKPVYLGVAVYPTVARFNHDCYPAVTRYFVGRNIVIRATRSLKPGDVVAENYGPIFTKRCLSERQRALAGRYWFRCSCKACQEDWPRFENLTNDSVKLRCPTEGCDRLYPPESQEKSSFKCSDCQKKISLQGQANLLRECEESYTRGMAAMEEERVEDAIEILKTALRNFHKVAGPPHRDTHLAEIALGSCMADSGNTWTVVQ